VPRESSQGTRGLYEEISPAEKGRTKTKITASMSNSILQYLTLGDLKRFDVPSIQEVAIENDWIVVTFKGQHLNQAPAHLPMAPARLKFRNWSAVKSNA
jgi:hypothetical protein